MKQLISVFLSFHLIVAPLSNVAVAAEEVPQSSSSYDAGSQHKGGYDFYIQQILTLSTSVIGANILTQCLAGFKVPSIAIYMAGAVTNIVAEISMAKKQAQRRQARMDELKVTEEFLKENGTGGEIQKQALEFRLQEEKDLRDYLKARKNWQIAISVVYLASMAAAIIEQIAATASMGTGSAITNAMCQAKPVDGGASMFSMVKLLGMAWGMASNMGGGGGKISSYGSMAINLLQMVVPSISSTVGMAYTSAIPRAITFGASAALSTTVSVGLGHRHSVARKNVEKLEAAIKQFKYETTDPDGFEQGSGNDGDKNKLYKNKAVYKGLAQGISNKECLSKTGNQYDFSSSACGKSLKLAPVKFNFSGISSDLASVGSMATDMANAAVSGDMGKANLLAGSLASQAGNMRRLVDSLQKAYNKNLKPGEKPVDFDKAIKDQVASLQSSVQQSAASSGMDLAALGSDTAKLAEEPKAEEAPAPEVASAPAAPQVPAQEMLDFTLPEDELPMEDIGSADASLEDKLGDYETTVSDISKKSDVSIFTQLSNRYLLNYTRIFESNEKKAAEPAK